MIAKDIACTRKSMWIGEIVNLDRPTCDACDSTNYCDCVHFFPDTNSWSLERQIFKLVSFGKSGSIVK